MDEAYEIHEHECVGGEGDNDSQLRLVSITSVIVDSDWLPIHVGRHQPVGKFETHL